MVVAREDRRSSIKPPAITPPLGAYCHDRPVRASTSNLSTQDISSRTESLSTERTPRSTCPPTPPGSTPTTPVSSNPLTHRTGRHDQSMTYQPRSRSDPVRADSAPAEACRTRATPSRPGCLNRYPSMGEHEDGTNARVLCEGVKAGSADSFGHLFDLHAPGIYRFLRQRIQDEDLAEDLLSVVFLEAWRCRNKAVVVDDRLAAWLYAIANNVLRNANRSRRRHAAALRRYAAFQSGMDQTDHADAVVSSLAAHEEADQVRAALERLPAQERRVIDHVVMQGRTISQTSTDLGIAPGTVKATLSHARAHLRASLKKGITRRLALLQTGDSPNPRLHIGHVQGERPSAAPSREMDPPCL